MLVAVGFSPLVVNTTVSYEMRAMPVAASAAPPVFALLLQPTPLVAGALSHGHAITPLAPGSHIEAPGNPQSGVSPHFARWRSPESIVFVNNPPANSAGPFPSSNAL